MVLEGNTPRGGEIDHEKGDWETATNTVLRQNLHVLLVRPAPYFLSLMVVGSIVIQNCNITKRWDIIECLTVRLDQTLINTIITKLSRSLYLLISRRIHACITWKGQDIFWVITNDIVRTRIQLICAKGLLRQVRWVLSLVRTYVIRRPRPDWSWGRYEKQSKLWIESETA